MVLESNYTFREFFNDIYQGILPYKKKFLIGVFFRFTSDIARLYPIWAISAIIPLLTVSPTNETLRLLLFLLVGWVVAVLYAGFTHDYSKYLGNQVAETVGLDLYRKCLSHVFRLDLSWQEKEGSGNKMKRIDRGRDGMNQMIRRIFSVLIEATSHLDGQSEKLIQQALSEVMHNFTTIVIAHRLSTIQEMDRIVVLEKGKIKEVGTFNELLAMKGSFAKMWRQQKLS